MPAQAIRSPEDGPAVRAAPDTGGPGPQAHQCAYGRKQFRVYGHDKQARAGVVAAILIHAANYPDELAGCIGPGLSKLPEGVDQSNAAMEKTFTVFGGFKEGTTGDLIVSHATEPAQKYRSAKPLCHQIVRRMPGANCLLQMRPPNAEDNSCST